jgi:hypothetical protein
MSAYVSNIIIDAGSDFSQTFYLEQSTNSPLNLSGYTGASLIKKHPAALKTIAAFVVSFPNRINGEIVLSLGSTITSTLKPGRYCYDVLLNSGTNVKTRVIEGSAIVTAGITT